MNKTLAIFIAAATIAYSALTGEEAAATQETPSTKNDNQCMPVWEKITEDDVIASSEKAKETYKNFPRTDEFVFCTPQDGGLGKAYRYDAKTDTGLTLDIMTDKDMHNEKLCRISGQEYKEIRQQFNRRQPPEGLVMCPWEFKVNECRTADEDPTSLIIMGLFPYTDEFTVCNDKNEMRGLYRHNNVGGRTMTALPDDNGKHHICMREGKDFAKEKAKFKQNRHPSDLKLCQ